MLCPYCGENRDKVVDSRGAQEGQTIRRRRECLACGKRFTTREHLESSAQTQVVKRDGSRVPYDRQRMIEGLAKACYKRPVSTESIEKLVDQVEEEALATHEQEIHSIDLGRAIAERLKALDQIAYVRFASVYKQFRDLDDILDEIRDVLASAASDPPEQGRLF